MFMSLHELLAPVFSIKYLSSQLKGQFTQKKIFFLSLLTHHYVVLNLTLFFL